MTEHTPDQIDGNAAALTTRECAAVAFRNAAHELIATAPADAQPAALEVVAHLAMSFAGDPLAEDLKVIKEWAATLRKDAGIQARRNRCVDAIHTWGAKVRSDSSQRLAYAAALVDDLQGIGANTDEIVVSGAAGDSVIERMRKACPWATAWRAELNDVAKKLETYDPSPSGKAGARGAERILAEMIVEGGPFLGLAALDDDDDEDEVETKAVNRICRRLLRDRSK